MEQRFLLFLAVKRSSSSLLFEVVLLLCGFEHNPSWNELAKSVFTLFYSCCCQDEEKVLRYALSSLSFKTKRKGKYMHFLSLILKSQWDNHWPSWDWRNQLGWCYYTGSISIFQYPYPGGQPVSGLILVVPDAGSCCTPSAPQHDSCSVSHNYPLFSRCFYPIFYFP